jgi:hypothetical protein
MFGMDVPATATFDYPSPAALAGWIADELQSTAEAAAARAAAAAAAAAIAVPHWVKGIGSAEEVVAGGLAPLQPHSYNTLAGRMVNSRAPKLQRDGYFTVCGVFNYFLHAVCCATLWWMVQPVGCW